MPAPPDLASAPAALADGTSPTDQASRPEPDQRRVVVLAELAVSTARRGSPGAELALLAPPPPPPPPPTAHPPVVSPKLDELKMRTEAMVTAATRNELEGPLSQDELVRLAIGRRLDTVQSCYERLLRQEPELTARFTVRAVVGRARHTLPVEIASTSTEHPRLQACVRAAFSQLFTPGLRDSVEVEVPINLVPRGADWRPRPPPDTRALAEARALN